MQPRENHGIVLLSLSYSPESKKLSVIILRAKDLNEGNAKDTGMCTGGVRKREGFSVLVNQKQRKAGRY